MDIDELLEAPYWVIDALPEQVPSDAAGNYFAVEQYRLASPRYEELRQRFAELILKLNCFLDISVSYDAGDTWYDNPVPQELVDQFAQRLDAYVLVDNALITARDDDTYLTLYNPSAELLERVQQLAAAAGLFVWQP